MGNTMKVGTSGRLGSRYGVGIRKRIIKVEEAQNLPITCPSCGFQKGKREAAGLFYCKKCGAKFTGGAYVPETLAGKAIKKMISQKTFNAEVLEKVLEAPKDTTMADLEKEVEKALMEPMPSEANEEKPRHEKKARARKEKKEEAEQ